MSATEQGVMLKPLGFCSCGKPAIKKQGGEPICARCAGIQGKLQKTFHDKFNRTRKRS
jgi:hypothetical protein